MNHLLQSYKRSGRPAQHPFEQTGLKFTNVADNKYTAKDIKTNNKFEVERKIINSSLYKDVSYLSYWYIKLNGNPFGKPRLNLFHAQRDCSNYLKQN